jgi:predicted DsbA family dithiol-disulfide isomerase
MTRRPVSVDVVSDVVCPWCYLGKRRLEHAIALVPDFEVAVNWRPYRLDPIIPPEGIDRSEYIISKFGSLHALDEAHGRLEAMGSAEGVAYRFDLISRTPDTTNAHRLVAWSAADGRQDRMVERLFSAYFGEGKDIGNLDMLATLAGEVGLDADTVASRLTGDEDRQSVAAEIDDAYRIGVTGVPCFILDGRYGIVGAHPAESIAAAIRKAASDRTHGTSAEPEL